MQQKEGKVGLVCQVSPELHQWLKEYCVKRKTNMTAYVREMLEEQMEMDIRRIQRQLQDEEDWREISR